MIGTRCRLIEIESKYSGKWLVFSEVTTLSRYRLEGKLEAICDEENLNTERERLKEEGKKVYWYRAR